MILLIDNYDSFTHNLAHLIGELGEDVMVKRNDALTASAALATGADAIFFSPGPKTPKDAGVCLDLVKAAAEAKKPLFGVCLGMQSIAAAFGGKIVRAGTADAWQDLRRSMHEGAGRFCGRLPSPFTAARYHSLVVGS